jgi:hypothetical protein
LGLAKPARKRSQTPALIVLYVVKYAFDLSCAVPDALIKRTLDFHKLVVRDEGSRISG